VLLTHSPQVTWAEAWSKKSATSIFPMFGKNWQLSVASIIHPLLTLLAPLTRQELARQVTYLRRRIRSYGVNYLSGSR